MENSLYHGVLVTKSGYTAQIARKGKVYYLGSYDTEKDAAEHVDRAVILTFPWVKNVTKRRFNFPESELQTIDRDRLTSWEVNMLAELREKYPGCERDHQKRWDINRAAGQHVDRIRRYFLLRRDFKESETEALDHFESTLEHFVSANIELEKLVEHYKEAFQLADKKLAAYEDRKPYDKNFFTPIPPKVPVVSPEPVSEVIEMPVKAEMDGFGREQEQS